MVVVEGDEGVVGTGQTVHTVAVICKYGELDDTLGSNTITTITTTTTTIITSTLTKMISMKEVT